METENLPLPLKFKLKNLKFKGKSLSGKAVRSKTPKFIYSNDEINAIKISENSTKNVLEKIFIGNFFEKARAESISQLLFSGAPQVEWANENRKRDSGGAGAEGRLEAWISMFKFSIRMVSIAIIPGIAERSPGTQEARKTLWISAFAGMTEKT